MRPKEIEAKNITYVQRLTSNLKRKTQRVQKYSCATDIVMQTFQPEPGSDKCEKKPDETSVSWNVSKNRSSSKLLPWVEA